MSQVQFQNLVRLQYLLGKALLYLKAQQSQKSCSGTFVNKHNCESPRISFCAKRIQMACPQPCEQTQQQGCLGSPYFASRDTPTDIWLKLHSRHWLHGQGKHSFRELLFLVHLIYFKVCIHAYKTPQIAPTIYLFICGQAKKKTRSLQCRQHRQVSHDIFPLEQPSSSTTSKKWWCQKHHTDATFQVAS